MEISYIGMPDKLQISFKKRYISDFIANLDKSSNGLEVDDTDDHNLRYVGSSPKNYISFNNELWRIIGIFNVYNDDTKKEEKLVKIINYGLENYSWDATGNNDWGINDWSESDLMKELNGDYLNYNLTSNQNWYNSYPDSNTNNPIFRQTGIFHYIRTIKKKYQNMINNSVWNLGANSYTGSAPYSLSLQEQYKAERETKTYQNSRAITWTGKVGLIYASDYGYASTNAECHNNMRAGVTYINGTWNYTNALCKNDNWLFKSNIWYWTLSPYLGDSSNVLIVTAEGAISESKAYNTLAVFPALFLKSDVLITGGTGIESDPYTID